MLYALADTCSQPHGYDPWGRILVLRLPNVVSFDFWQYYVEVEIEVAY